VGNNSPARIAMMAMTTSSSIRVKAVTSGEWRVTLGDWRLALGYCHRPRLGPGGNARGP